MYVKAAVVNIEEKIRTLHYMSKQCPTPMKTGYHPSKEVRYYQELIGV